MACGAEIQDGEAVGGVAAVRGGEDTPAEGYSFYVQLVLRSVDEN